MGEYFLGDAMHEYLKKSRLNSGLKSVQIEEIWEKIMGKTIAKYTDKIQIIKKTLFIKTNVAPLKQEIMYQKEFLIRRLNEEIGEGTIENIVLN